MKKKRIVFATNNQHKLQEIRHILDDSVEVLSLQDIGCDKDIPETGTTLEENARQKAEYIWEHYHCDVFADDTGLEVEALDGAPGVYSARYAGEAHDSEANMTKLLHELADKDNRKARFRTVIALLEKKDVCPCGCTSIKQEHLFEGIVDGEITHERSGVGGFGYDPIFQPEGYDKTFAELGETIKNQISHRGRATRKLAEYLLKGVLSLCLFFFMNLTASAQIGTWKAYMSYYEPQQIVKAGNTLFVRASNDLYSYNLTDNSITTYDKVNALSDTYISAIAWNPATSRLIICYQNSNIDLMDREGNVTNISALYSKTMTQDKTINTIYIADEYAYLGTGFGVVKVNMKRMEIAESYILNQNIMKIGTDATTIYVQTAKGSVLKGLLSSNLIDSHNWSAAEAPADIFATNSTDWDDFIDIVRTLSPGGPKYNHFGFMRMKDGVLYTCGGGYSADGDLNRPATVQINHDDEWTFLQDDMTGVDGTESSTWRFVDMLSVDVDPLDNKHIFAGGRPGLFEYYDGQLVKYYHKDNSILHTATTSNKYVLVETLKYDDEGNLWLLQSQVTDNSLMQIPKGGELASIPQEELMDNGKSLSHMKHLFIDSRGLLWFVNDFWGSSSIHCYDPKSNQVLHSFKLLTNQDGTTYDNYSPQSIAEDFEGNIWIGTSIGPFLVESSNVYIQDTHVTQVKVPRNDGSNFADYLLNGANISCIAIDGGGRKWIGTYGAGAYLISADNMTQLQNFTTLNSPLLSDNIESIAINNETGEVFFGTDNGLCSYMGDAIDASVEMSKDNVYAYPNPVASGYNGLITIVGLTLNADVKILTASGQLVAEGRSNGGTFTWDGRDRSGHRVASGVYMVATATSDGKKGTVCKIAVIR